MIATLRTFSVAASLALAACGGGSDKPDPTDHVSPMPTDGTGTPHPTDRITPTPTPTDHPTPPPTTCLENGMCVSHPRVSTEMFRYADVDYTDAERIPIIDRLGLCDGDGCSSWCADDTACSRWKTNEPYIVRDPACDGPEGTGCLYLRNLGMISISQVMEPWTFRYVLRAKTGVSIGDDDNDPEVVTITVPPEGTLVSGIPPGAYRIDYETVGGLTRNPGFSWEWEQRDTPLYRDVSAPILAGATTGIVANLRATTDALTWAPGRWKRIEGAPECPEFTDVRVELWDSDCADHRWSDYSLDCSWIVIGFCPDDAIAYARDAPMYWTCARFDGSGNELPRESTTGTREAVFIKTPPGQPRIRYLLIESVSTYGDPCPER